ncbi:MAG: DUF805 domain-containing protein [Deltaproteobacteria bacterium]|jgi:uncharacterized membrane protein YhaH (DUF805 family)|nr:DUF805 domain-containing protein [Deltaproteobacteria bacterium]
MTTRKRAQGWYAWAGLFLSPRGRIDRDTYWTSYWIVLLGFGCSAIVGEGLGTVVAPTAKWVLAGCIGAVAWWSWLALSIKRAHDLDETGWSVVFGAWRLFNQPGTIGPNRYGSPTQNPYAKRRWASARKRAPPAPPRTLEERSRADRLRRPSLTSSAGRRPPP